METKNASTARSTAEASTSRENRVGEFFGEVKGELARITWTTREELIVYTKIVVVATFMLGIGIYFTDLIIQTALNGLSYFVRLLTG